ncbi:unnamed protein product [Prorocentrum cordatum]|uniref:Uncharacterized protein n=1 Tax=Prorocentrum cordatum TaxID=2364126 RepID=A0ABN9VEA8_9DINO|nr:unnamed protein product [Polarella glacialis]
MAPHLSKRELDRCFSLYAAGKIPVEIRDLVSRTRESLDETGPDLTTARRALRGAAHRRGPAETRGRKPKLTAVKLRALNNARVRLIRAAKGEAEVHLKDVMTAARVSDVHKGTASRHFKRLGVTWRAPRAEPLRGSAEAEERVAARSGWKRLPGNYFTHQVDAIIDNKVSPSPMTKRAKTHAKKSRVRGHLRTKAEGVLKPFTKPKGNRNRVNPGAKVHVAAAIVNNKVRVWHYLPTLWCADAACDFYAGVLAPALRRCRKGRRAFRILEDNDPTGYKSKKAVDCKRGLKITPIKFPKYSPDLNPLDYFLWAEVNRRMAEQSAPANESQTACASGPRGTQSAYHCGFMSFARVSRTSCNALPARLMAHVQDRGAKTMQRFVRSRVRKLTADLEETKEWASARENAAFEAVDDWTLVCRCAEETCPHGPACSYRSAVETIFSRSAASFDVRELAASLRDILMVGPKTTRVPFLVGPSNSGKSTVVYPFDDLFTPKRVLHKPALGSSFGLRNLASGTKRFIFWDDFRPVEFAHEKTVPVSLFLSLFVGQRTEIQVSQSFNDGNKDVCWNHGAVFTGKLEGLWGTTNKVGAEDIRHMQNRARHFPFSSVLSDGSLQDVLSCAPCMTAWIVREAAKFDAVGVFRPAPAAPVGADAGVPPVSGFDDLMSDARISRAQADALLADVRAMGAVAVDEVLPADWVRLNSWALLQAPRLLPGQTETRQVLSGFEVVLTAVLVLMAIGVDADAVETKAIRDALKAVLVGKDLKHISLRERRRQVALKLGLQEHALDQRKHEFKSLTTDVVSETQPDQDAASPLETVLAEAEKLDSLQWVYLVTISRVLDATLPDGRQHRDLGTMSREDIGKAVDDAFNNPIPTGSAGGRPRKEPDGQALVSMAVVFQEKHKDGAIHFHVAVKLTRSGRFQQAKRTLRERHLLPSHFSGSHQRMWSAVRYGYMETPAKPDVDDAPWVWQPDWAGFARENDAIDLFEMSQEPCMAGVWVKRREATDKAAGAMGAKTTFDLVDLTSTIIAKHLWTKGSLMAYVQDRGTKAMQRFVRSRVRKLTADLEETKEWASAREIAAFEAVDDWTLVCRCAEETCPHGPACSYRSAVETIFSRNAASFDVRELAASLRDILMVGPKKTTGVPFLVGPSNSGKSTVVYPFDDLFTPKRVLHKPTLGSSFGLRNLASGTKRFIFWGDFRPVEFAHENTVPVSLFLSLFVGQHTEIQVSQSFNDGNKDVCWNHGAVFTGKLEGLWETTNKVGAEDIRHMQNRARQFPFTSVLSDGSLQDVLSCAPCTTAWIVREAAKFDAVGVFRPAPAAPVGADAGVPPVSGFDDLMSDARIPRAQADALLADVRAMGAVAVDEMAPHLSKRELDRCFSLYAAGKIPVEIRDLVSRTRESLDETGPDLTTVRRALRGAAHRRGPAETRGRKPKLTAVKLRALNNARVRLIRAAKGEAEVHLKDVMMAARVSDAHKGTASRHSKRLGVTWRAPRAEPLRGSAEAEERVAARSGWKRLPGNYFTHQVDAIIDNKVFPSPMTKRAKTHAKKSRVRGHLRTKAEGVLKPFTKPKGNRNRVNPGAKVHVAAAIVNNKVRVWHYLPTLWCADAACDFYAGVLAPALRRCRKGRRAFRILEDNDPTGYKSKKAVDCKMGLKITPIKFPKYSPDLNPLDYFLWAEVNRRMAEQSAPANESQTACASGPRGTQPAYHCGFMSFARVSRTSCNALPARLMAHVQDRGTKTMQRFVRSRVRKLTADLEETKEWASARENAAFEAVDDWTLVCRCAEETCPHGPACSYRSAVETIFSRSAASFDVRELAASLRDILMVGPKKTTRVPFLVGPSNSGKSTVVYPFDDLFTPKRVLHKPALGSSFGLRNLASGTKRFIFWDDFRPVEFAHEKTVPVSLFLSLFVGQHTEIQVSQSFNDGNKDVCWNHGAVFTGKLEGLWGTTNKVGAEDIRHMQNRARQFPFTSVLSDGSLQDVLSCAPCMTAWIVREAAKSDAVGVFRPAPAAPVGADAGVPPVSGFDDLMSDARPCPRAAGRRPCCGCPALMGAVAVDEVLPADWVRLNSWALLQGALPGACNVELAAGAATNSACLRNLLAVRYATSTNTGRQGAEALAGPDRTAPGPFEFCGALRLLRRRLRQKTDTGYVVPSPPVPSAGVDAEAVETKAIRDALKAVLVGKDLKHISSRECRRQVALKLGLQEHALDQRKHEFKSLTTEVVSETQPDQDAASPLETVLAEAEKLDSLQWVYLVTISRVLDATLPDGRQYRDLGTMSREDIGKAAADAFNNPIPTGSAGGRPRKEPDGQALVSMALVFQEKHKDGAIHFHVAVKLTRSGRFQQAKRTLRERHLLPSHFSGSHRRMWSAVRYGYMETPAKPDVDDAPWVWQPDWAGFARENDAIDLFEMSQEPYMAGVWVKRREATDKAAGAMGTKTTFDLVDLTSTIIAKHLWTKGSLMAYVQDRGTKAMQRFVRSRVRKLTADLEETKEWASARENAAFVAVDDCAASFDVRELAASLRDILMVGPKKTTRVPFLVGPSNSGKSTVVYPFDDLFTPKRVLHKPALGSSFGLRNLASGTKRFIFWGDFRPVEFAYEKTVPVSLFLSLFVGQHTEIQVSQSFNDGNKGVCWNHGAVFTGKLEGLWETTNKVGAEDIRHMQNRARQFPFTSVLSDGSLQDVLSCAPCMTAWSVREAAKFDAVGVFRPAPAAPVGADAGVPPVSGFDDLMSDARIPRAQADALLADVRAMGAVAVDEVLPADWMAPHLSKRELDRCFSLYAAGKTPVEIRDLVSRTRESLDETGPDLTTVRRALRGATHRRGPAETRGRKPKLTAVKLRAVNNARVRLIRAAKGEAEVHLKDVMKAARVSDVHKGTATRHFKRLGVTWRAPRAEPLRGSAEAEERVAVLKPFTKPKGNRNRVNPGAKVHVAAAIVNNKVRVWHYLPTLWCADAACDFYAGVLAPALRRCRKGRRAFRILEDNDPTGYKSKKAVDCKRRGLKITPIKFPKYSPDLNPLDYFLWAEVNRRMAEQSAPANERVATGIPKSVIRAAVAKMKTKAAEVVVAEGGRIPSD